MREMPPVSGSLQHRLLATLIAGTAILALLLFFAIRSYATQIAQEGQDNILRSSAASILDAALLREGRVEVDIPYASFSMLSTPADDRVFYAIYRDDVFLSGYEALRPAARPSGREGAFQNTAFDGVAVRQVTATRPLVGAEDRVSVRVVLAQTQDALSVTLDDISRTAVLFCLGFFVLTVLLSLWASSNSIGELKRLSDSVTRRGPQDLSPFQKPVPSEMLPLVTSLNSLMGRLDQSLRQSEDFIAEAAHRVRTPLATVRSYAETTLHRVDKEENRQAMRSMVRAIDESSRAAGQLLDHAMIAFRADHLDREDIDLVDLVRDLVQRLTPIAEMRDVDLVLQADEGVECSGDPVLIQNAVRNLIDNALKYSPSESCVQIAVKGTPHIHVRICDEGPGFPEDEMDTLAARFTRGQNAHGTIGSGLGLTIAQDVARAHGGALSLSNREEGGACAVLSF